MKRILKAAIEKQWLTYKDNNIGIISDLSAQTLNSRKSWNNVIQALRENNCQPRILYPAKLPFNLDGEIRIFQNKDKLNLFMTTHHALQRIVKEIIHMEDDEKQSQA
jgi:hypothetical protein